MQNIWTLLGNFSKEMKTMSQMAIWEIKKMTAFEMKHSFVKLIIKLGKAKERISEYKDRSTGNYHKEKKKKWKQIKNIKNKQKNRTEHPRAVWQ